MNVCENGLADMQISNIVTKKMKKAKASIIASAISYLAFIIAVVCVILVISAVDIEADLELIFFAMGVLIFISGIVGIVCSSNALFKIKGEQLLEGKDLSRAKAGKIMSCVALSLTVLYVIVYIALLSYLAVLLYEGFFAFIELFGLLGSLFEQLGQLFVGFVG